jgi:hypothetical protein
VWSLKFRARSNTKKYKHQHWRGSWHENAANAAPMLVFCFCEFNKHDTCRMRRAFLVLGKFGSAQLFPFVAGMKNDPIVFLAQKISAQFFAKTPEAVRPK